MSGSKITEGGWFNFFILPGKREVQDLSVKCTSVDRGCEWEGNVGTLEKHVDTCEFALIPCPKLCKDENSMLVKLLRGCLNEHLENNCPERDYECEFCAESGTYSYITEIHDNLCMKKILPCPNADCTISTERRSMKRHLESCVYTEVPCKYQKLGCDIKIERNAISVHEESEDKHHFHLALEKIVSQEYLLASELLGNGESMTFKVTEFSKKKDKNEIVPSPAFYAGIRADNSQGLYHMQVEIYTDGNKVGGGYCTAYFKILEGRYDDVLKWPFTGTATLTLLNQLENARHHKGTISFSMEKNARVGYTESFSGCIHHSQLSEQTQYNKWYLKDDTLYFNVSVEVTDKRKPWLTTGAVSGGINKEA